LFVGDWFYIGVITILALILSMTNKYCPECGTKAPLATSNFCTSCGQSLNTLTTTTKTAKASRQIDDDDGEGSNVFAVPELDSLEVSISGDDDDDKYVQTLNSFSFTASGGTTPKKFKPRHI
jgi:hypothetical protein